MSTKNEVILPGKIYTKLPKELLKEIYRYIPGKGRFRWVEYESGHNPLYVEERAKRICEKALEGRSISDIAADHDISERHVKRILSDNGIQKRKENKGLCR